MKLRSKSKTKSKSKTNTHLKTTYWIRPLLKTAMSYHSFANVPYCPGDVINQLACPLCDVILENSFEVYKFHKHEHKGHTFTYVLLFSVNRNEAVISLSGPRHPDPAFYSTIYSRGFQQMAAHPDIKIEKTYIDIYGGEFADKLRQTVLDYKKKFNTQKDHRFIFVGHNIGGSLATLAAFDLISRRTIDINVELDTPLVYSYGALRIGDSVFVNQVNASFRVIRVVKAGDMYPRMPSCTWSPSINRFRCEEEFDTWEHTRKKDMRPELLNYIQNYYGTNGGLQSGIEEPFRGNRMTFLQTKEKGKNLKGKNNEEQSFGWAYSANNPGYLINNLGDPFDEHGRTNDKGLITYSQPLGAEVLFSNNFKRHTVCSYFYGIPNCEKGLAPEFDPKVGNKYFGANLNDC